MWPCRARVDPFATKNVRAFAFLRSIEANWVVPVILGIFWRLSKDGGVGVSQSWRSIESFGTSKRPRPDCGLSIKLHTCWNMIWYNLLGIALLRLLNALASR